MQTSSNIKKLNYTEMEWKMIVKDGQNVLDPEWDTDVGRGKLDVLSGKMCYGLIL